MYMNMKNESDYKFLCIKIVCGFNQRTLWTMLCINGIFCQCIAFYFCNGCKYLGHVCLKGIWKSALIPPIWCDCQIWLGLWSLYWHGCQIWLIIVMNQESVYYLHTMKITSPLFKCFLLWIFIVPFLWVMMLVRLLVMLGRTKINQILCWSTFIYIFSLAISITI